MSRFAEKDSGDEVLTATGCSPVRVGMIGTGWMAEEIAPDFDLCEDVELVAVAGRGLNRASRFASIHGIPRALDSEALIRDGEVELIYVATTHESHYELARAALEHGKHVLVEKAFTVDTAHAEELINLARSRGLFLMEAMWMRFNPVIQKMRTLLEEGAIGEPRTLQASFGMAVPTTGGSRLWDPLRAGGALLDMGVYPLALADIVLGEPDRVTATGSNLDYDGLESGVDSEVAALLGYDDGRQALVSTSIRSWLPLGATVAGSGGWITIDPAFWCSSKLTLSRPNREPVVETAAIEGKGYVPMLRATAQAVAAGRVEHPLSNHASTLRVMRTIDRVATELGR